MHARTARAMAVAFTFFALTAFWAPPTMAASYGAPFKRAAENITQAPLDLALAPYIAVEAVVRNLYMSKKYSDRDKILLTVIPVAPCGMGFMTLVSIGTAVGRGCAGFLDIPMGLAGLIFRFESPSLFTSGDAPAVVDVNTSAFHFKFGINHAPE